MSEIISTFDHLSTQLTLVELRVKVLKCKLWNPSGIFSSIKIHHGYILVTDGLNIFGVLVDSQDFVTQFLDEVLSQDVAHINDLPFLGIGKVVLGIFFFMCHSLTFLFHMDSTSFFFLPIFFGKFG
jgi:hypothetical protein